MNRKINVAVCVIFLALLFGVLVAHILTPDKDFSESENRKLQTLPLPTASGCLDGSVTGALTTYCADQFPMRTSMVGLRSLYDLSLGRGESDGVLIGRGGQQAVRLFDAWLSRTERANDTDYAHDAHIHAGTQALATLKDTLADADIPLYVMIPPRTVDVTMSAFDYPSDLSDRLHTLLYGDLSEAGVAYVDMTGAFRERFDAGEYVYYRTDHHWTTAGAYLAYTALMETMGQGGAVIPAEAFTVRRIENFYGTTYSRAGMYFVPPDTLEIWAVESDDAYLVTDDQGQEIMHGFISESYLAGKDKYGAFLDGTHRLITVTQISADPLATSETGAIRPRLLLARDSFASAMIPFLARHFDIVAVNLSGGMTNLSELAETYGCDAVLVLCNLENLVTSDCVRNIK